MKNFLNCVFVILGVVFALPNMLPSGVNSFLTDIGIFSRPVPLGLDLAGGARFVMEVDMSSLKEEKLLILQGELRRLLNNAGVPYDVILVDEGLLEVYTENSNKQVVTNVIDTEVRRSYGDNYFEVNSFKKDGKAVVRVQFVDSAWLAIVGDTRSQTLSVMRKRVDAFGVSEAQIYPYGDNRIVIEMPGVRTEELKNLIGRTAKLEIRVVKSVSDNVNVEVPAGHQLIEYSGRDRDDGDSLFYVIEGYSHVTGANLVGAQAGYSGHSPVVNVKFDSEGAAKFAVLTKKHLGESVAVLLDGKPITILQLKSVIIDGNGAISGGFDEQEANNLAVLLRSGSLAAPMTILEEGYVGPELGAESMHLALQSLAVAFLFITLFMFVQYGLLGVLSILSVVVNMVIVLGIFTFTGIALSVAGIAAYVLAMGFNIDNNIYVLERLKELMFRDSEKNSGRQKRVADMVSAAYSVSVPAIVDANLTNAVAAIILLFGSWVLQAFAFSLLINVAVSVWSTFFISRTVLLWAANKLDLSLKKRGY